MFGTKLKNSWNYLLDVLGPVRPLRWLVWAIIALPLFIGPALFYILGRSFRDVSGL